MKIILASSSKYRQQLLQKLGLPFQKHAPNINETALPNERAKELASRLAKEKAIAVAKHYPEHLIIASDQSAQLGDSILGKPGNKENAIKQLSLCSGNRVTFYTAVSVLNSCTGKIQCECLPYQVHFRKLSRQQIRNYIDKEEPLDCAGSFKCEGLGIRLFEKLEGGDPNILIGLPLITLNTFLLNEGIDPLFL